MFVLIDTEVYFEWVYHSRWGRRCRICRERIPRIEDGPVAAHTRSESEVKKSGQFQLRPFYLARTWNQFRHIRMQFVRRTRCYRRMSFNGSRNDHISGHAPNFYPIKVGAMTLTLKRSRCDGRPNEREPDESVPMIEARHLPWIWSNADTSK